MKISGISNLLARSFIIFILAYLWLSFYLNNLIQVFLFSFCIMLFVNYLFVIWGRRRNTRIALTRKQQEHLHQIMLQLKFSSRTKSIELFKAAFECLKHTVRAAPKKLVIEPFAKNENSDAKVQDSIINFFTLFDAEVTIAHIVACINATGKNAKTYIAAESFSPAVVAFAKALKKEIVLLDALAVYERILQPSGVFPEIMIEYKTRKRLTFAELRQIMFRRTKVRTYLMTGIIILFTSLIVPLNIYYVIVATVVFSFALVSLLAPRTESGVL